MQNADILEFPQPNKNSTLSGLLLALQSGLGSTATLTYDTDFGWSVSQNGTFAEIVSEDLPPAGFANYSYSNPTEQILTQINSLAFVAATDYQLWDADSSALPPVQKFVAQEYADKIHYRTRWPYLFGALASTLVCVVCILPSYWGFWELGHAVTLDPFEIATAFRAPVFEAPEAHKGQMRPVLKRVGTREVRYGPTLGPDGTILAFNDK